MTKKERKKGKRNKKFTLCTNLKLRFIDKRKCRTFTFNPLEGTPDD